MTFVHSLPTPLICRTHAPTRTCVRALAEDALRLTEQEAPPPTSNYGAVDPAGGDGGPEHDRQEGQHQSHRRQAAEDLGWGARLYLLVLLVVGLSGLVSEPVLYLPPTPRRVCIFHHHCPARCPPLRYRASLAMFWFSEAYHPRPGACGCSVDFRARSSDASAIGHPDLRQPSATFLGMVASTTVALS